RTEPAETQAADRRRRRSAPVQVYGLGEAGVGGAGSPGAVGRTPTTTGTSRIAPLRMTVKSTSSPGADRLTNRIRVDGESTQNGPARSTTSPRCSPADSAGLSSTTAVIAAPKPSHGASAGIGSGPCEKSSFVPRLTPM